MNECKGNDLVFKTYLKGKSSGDGKGPDAKQVKGKTKIMTFEEASKNDCFGAILNDDFIDISFDSDELSEKFWNMSEENGWKCLILENTENGHIHSFWKDSEKKITKGGADLKLAVGLIADIHAGSTYIPLRVHGSDRFPPSFEPDVIQEVPDELLPVNTQIDLLSLHEGDGRNDSIFKYILVLQSQLQLEKEQIKRILYNINHFIFTEPLPSDELETITRDEAFAKPVFFEGRSFQHNVFGDYLIREMHIKRIKGQLHVYRDGIYVSGYKYIENAMQKMLPSLRATHRTETLKYLEVMNPDETDVEADAKYIAFRNGILNIYTMELIPFSPDYIITNKIPWDYNENAYSEILDQALDQWSCHDQEIRSILEECVGYCFYRKNHLQKSFILTGEGANGKSTFLDMLKALLTLKNYSALDLCELDDKFSTIMMSGKLANIGDDISGDFLQGKTLSIFRKVVTGNDIKAENKGVDAYTIKPTAKLFFSANNIPRMASKGIYAVKRRLVIIPFNAKFESKLEDGSDNPEYDDLLGEKLKDQAVMEYLILLGVQGLKRALKNKSFTQSNKVEKELEEFEKDNDPVAQWLEGLKSDDEGDETIIDYLTREYLETIYLSYSDFCQRNNCRPLSCPNLSKELVKRFGFTRTRPTLKGRKYTLFHR